MDRRTARGRVLVVGSDAVAEALEAADAGLSAVVVDAGEVSRAVADGTVDCVVVDADGAEVGPGSVVGTVRDHDDLVPVVVAGSRRRSELPATTLVDAYAYLQRDPDGALPGLVETVEGAVDCYRRRRDRQIVAEAGPGGACLVRDGTVAYANPALADSLGVDRDALTGTAAADLATAEDRADLVDRLEAAAGGERVSLRFDADRPDARPLVLESRWAPVERPDGTAVVGTLLDVTDAARREEDLQRDSEMLTSLLENIPMSVYFKDRQSRHVRVSDHMLHTDPSDFIRNEEGKVHCHPEDIIGKTDFDLYAPEFAEQTIADDRSVMEAEESIVNRIEEGTTNLGETQYTSTTKAPRYDEDGNVIGLVGVTVDVTEREQHKRELERQNERLEEFAEVLTHDLRNPLNIARGYLDVLDEEYDPAHVEECSGALDRMEALIEEIRAFVLQGRTVDDPEPVDLADAAHQAWRTVDTADATLQVDTDLTVEADPERLQRVLENLYRNAVEHGSTSPPSQSREDAVQHGGDGVTVTVGSRDGADGFYVADDGPGIPADERDRVFEHGFTTSEEGTGFGLAIVKDIAEAHGWTVEVADCGPDGDDLVDRPSGACFEFSEVVRAEPTIGRTIR